MYDLWDTACKRNGFIKFGLFPSEEQSLCWIIQYKIFLYYLLRMICGKLHVKVMVSLNEYKIFLYYLLGMICGTLHVKEIFSLNMTFFLVRNKLSAG